jgi:hypothetical protein
MPLFLVNEGRGFFLEWGIHPSRSIICADATILRQKSTGFETGSR